MSSLYQNNLLVSQSVIPSPMHRWLPHRSGGQAQRKAQGWWELDFMPLGESLKTSFKRKQNPFSAPRTADEWEPYLKEKRAEVDALRRKLADAEVEINERVYRLFALTTDEVTLLKKEVEH